MSDAMLHGVLNMPTDLWSDDPLDVEQRHCRYVQASKKIKTMQADTDALKEMLYEVCEKQFVTFEFIRRVQLLIRQE